MRSADVLAVADHGVLVLVAVVVRRVLHLLLLAKDIDCLLQFYQSCSFMRDFLSHDLHELTCCPSSCYVLLL
jgi:hypothetical protein